MKNNVFLGCSFVVLAAGCGATPAVTDAGTSDGSNVTAMSPRWGMETTSGPRTRGAAMGMRTVMGLNGMAQIASSAP